MFNPVIENLQLIDDSIKYLSAFNNNVSDPVNTTIRIKVACKYRFFTSCQNSQKSENLNVLHLLNHVNT